MLKKDVVAHFKTQSAVARALGISHVAVSKWPDIVPESSAYKLQVVTENKLRVDPALYGAAPTQSVA